MKKIINKSLVALMALLTIAGCGENSTSTSNTSNNSSNVVLTETEKIEKMLNDLRKGVKFVGSVNQTSTMLDGDHGSPTGEVVENSYKTELTFQSGKENAYASYVSTTLEDGSEQVYFNNKVFQGEDGYAYYYDLNYDNKVTKFPFLSSSGEKVNFGYYCLNPFSYLKVEDFIKVDGKENTYTLSNDKASVFSANVFGDIDAAFYDVLESIEFVVDGTTLKSFTIVPSSVYDMAIDYETWTEVYYYLEQIATFEVKDIATATVSKPSSRQVTSNREELDKLQAAFDKYSANNYTINMKIQYSGDYEGVVSYATYYYTGEHLYYSRQENQTTPNAETDILLYDNGGEFLVPYGYSDEDSENEVVFTERAASSFKGYSTKYKQYTYEDVNPKISDVSADLFDYDKTFKNYNVCDEIVADFATKAIVPQINEMSSYLDGYGETFKVRLTDSGDIDYITFNFNYNDGFFARSASVRLTFSNVGTTVLPYNLVIA